MAGKSSEITAALLKGCYLLSVYLLAVFMSHGIGVNLLGAVQTRMFESHWQRNPFRGQTLVKLWSSLDSCVRLNVTYASDWIAERIRAAQIWGCGQCVGLVWGLCPSGTFMASGGVTIAPTSDAGEQIRAELHVGTWCWKRPVGLQSYEGAM